MNWILSTYTNISFSSLSLSPTPHFQSGPLDDSLYTFSFNEDLGGHPPIQAY
ncbi:unnamed protein product, partial [Dovyalis caffra]